MVHPMFPKGSLDTLILMIQPRIREAQRDLETSIPSKVIISILLEPEVHQLPDGAQLVRALNVLTVKMIDRSDPTAITCAFIRQLRESVGNTGVSQDFTEMVSSQEL